MDSVSVVVPVYNSAATLPELIQRIKATLDPQGIEYEILLINDGSRDESWPVITDLALSCRKVRGINLMRNFGQHNALLCGIRNARFEMIVTLDDDLQNPPEEIPRLIGRLTEGYDVVYGTPAIAQHGLGRNLASQTTKMIMRSLMGVEAAEKISAFRAFNARLRDAFAIYNSPFINLDVLLSWGSLRFGWIEVRHEERRQGASNYGLKKLLTHALNMITGYSTVPLRLASIMGFVFTLFGLLTIGYVVGRFFIQGSPVPGFPFLASIISIFSGAQLFTIGIIGEYLARIYSHTMSRPVYTIRQQTDEI